MSVPEVEVPDVGAGDAGAGACAGDVGAGAGAGDAGAGDAGAGAGDAGAGAGVETPLAEVNALAKIVVRYLTARMFYLDGQKQSFSGSIPVNLDAPFNMGKKAREICHPNIGISWMRLLASLKFTVTWEGNRATVLMYHYHEIYHFAYAATCPHSIKLALIQFSIENSIYRTILALAHDILKSIMIELYKSVNSTVSLPAQE